VLDLKVYFELEYGHSNSYRLWREFRSQDSAFRMKRIRIRIFDRIYRIDRIMISPCQAGCLAGNSSASGGESFQPLFRSGWKTPSLLPSYPVDPVNPVKCSSLLPA